MSGPGPAAAAAPGAAAAGPAAPRLTLLGREGCHLCEEMATLLGELFEPGDFRLERVDIDEDRPDLLAAHHVRVPVLFLEGRELCHHFLDARAVSDALAGYNRPA